MEASDSDIALERTGVSWFSCLQQLISRLATPVLQGRSLSDRGSGQQLPGDGSAFVGIAAECRGWASFWMFSYPGN